MFARIVILDKQGDSIDGGPESVTIGIFDERGILQLEIPRISGKLFPKDVTKGKQVVFTNPAKISKISN